MSQNLAYALKYMKLGYSVIPCNKEKKPLVKWEEFQKRLATENEIRDWFKKYPDANVGLVTGIISGLCVFDQDDQKAIEYLNDMLPEGMEIPCSTTPRGGMHYWFQLTDSTLRNSTAINGYKLDFRGEGGYILAPPSSNGNGKSYEFVVSPKNGLPKLPDNLIALLKKSPLSYSPPYINTNNTNIATNMPDASISKMFTSGRRDNDLFHVAYLMIKGGAKRDEVAQVLEILAKNCIPPFPENEIEDKIRSAVDRKIRNENGLTEIVKSIILQQECNISVSSVTSQYIHIKPQQPYQTVTSIDSLRANIRMIFKRLKDAGIIKPAKKAGEYVLVDNKCDILDIENVSTEEHPLRLPFGLREWVKIMPKNLIITAGAKSSGKTAFLLNTAFMNRDYKGGVCYYNSEMAVEELRIRINEFENNDLKEWKKIKFFERNAEFADVVKNNPDAIHIIDFLEIYDNFYQVGEFIRNIHDALDKGIAIIALQKNTGVDLGLGGARSIEKARLYLALDYGRIKIVDAKLFAKKGINPRGWIMDYKLVNGCNYIEDVRGWYDPQEKI